MNKMKEETRKLLDELMERPSSAYLATIDKNGSPSIRAVFNLRCKESFAHPAKVIKEYDKYPYSVYISTNTSSVKMKHIENNKKIALYFSIPDEGKGIMFQGEVEILDDLKFKESIWMKNWNIYYPKGYEDPDFTILKLKPKIMRGWFRGHFEYNFTD
ncbi:MAG: Pyridoxine/pyridoxamine 5'-phosphate oxidase [Candidatus Heimdallarchaeota archaeon AB_125]|nr:MAG: Pyridoxine/pyridoxamine 5'-phosphate oxidase [Candidatus Heimdallarchaeota archaeon AB_125]